jgi:Ca-activated chloride channel family protein
MVAHSPRGPRQRYAHALTLTALALAGFALTGCGGGAKHAETGGEQRLAKVAAPALALEEDFNRQNAESYGSIVENEFRSPLVAPLSTFSAEVNTAGYANVRRFIQQQNKRPPRDAVLLAEMVNYFPYSYPPPAGDAPVSVTLDLAPCPWKPEHKLARIGVRSKDIPAAELPPRNLVFLIDTSGSMGADNRLPLVKKALNLLTDTLTGRDRVTIVTYAGEAGVRLTPTGGDRKAEIRAAIDRLTAGGGTNGEGGITLAYEIARRSFIEGGANRVILCTDGDFNVGVSDPSELQRLIEKERTSGVFLSVLGFGMGNYKDDRLKTLANYGNGTHAYIDGMDEARKVFVEQGGALVCVAKDVKFQVEFNAARVAAYRLIGYENRLMKAEDFKNDAKDAADIGSGYAVTALYEVVPVGVKIELPGVDPLKYQKPAEKAGAGDEWLTAKVRYKHPDGDKSRELSAALKGDDRPMGEDFRFASAVAEFGLLLRDSPFKGSASFDAVIERANGALGADTEGHRKEFVELVRKAKGLPKE